MVFNTRYLSMLMLLVMIFGSGLLRADSTLDRRASWQAKFEATEANRPGKVVKSMQANSPLELAGVEAGDRLISIDGQVISNQTIWNDLTDALVSGHEYVMVFKRGQSAYTSRLIFSGLIKESHPKIDTIYDHITSDYGIKQRVIITVPKNKKPKQAAMVVLQGLSCSSIEQIPGRKSAFVRLLTDLIKKSDRVVMRVEKPGMGDSEGNCSETDFHTELNGYESAVRWFLEQDYVDKEQVIVYGNSMGSALAPYVANKFNLAGVISDGTYVRSWFEHMLEIERRILSFKGLSQSEISQKMNAEYIPLYYGMLIKKQTYQQVIDEHPALADANYHGAAHMYGRPMAFYHQLQAFDVAGEWQKLKMPARIRWGMNDWIMSEADNDMIIEILRQAGHPNHELYKQPGLDHWQAIHKEAIDSFQGVKGTWDDDISAVILNWLDTI